MCRYNLPFRYTLFNIALVSFGLVFGFVYIFINGDSRGVIYSLYGILCGLTFAYFCRYINYLRQNKLENHQECVCATSVFPVFRYDTERARMEPADDVPLYTFVNLAIVACWSMLICITDVKYYLIGIFITCLAFSFAAIYMINVLLVSPSYCSSYSTPSGSLPKTSSTS